MSNQYYFSDRIVYSFILLNMHSRDSKLTKLLKNSLCGDSITMLIACISPLAIHSDGWQILFKSHFYWDGCFNMGSFAVYI